MTRILGLVVLAVAGWWLWRYLSASRLSVDTPAFSIDVGKRSAPYNITAPPAFAPPLGATGGASADDCGRKKCAC